MEKIQSLTPTNVEGFGLLDLLVIMAENAKLLVIGPLLAGLCALALSLVLPQKTFQSVAVLQADQATVGLMTTAAVLDPVAASLGIDKEHGVEGARGALRANIKAVVGRTDKLLTLTVSAPTPAQAQAMANALLQQTYLQSRPKGSLGERLQAQLAEAQGRLNKAEIAAAALVKRLEVLSPNSSANGSYELARGYADLLTVAAAAQQRIGELEAQLEGLTDAKLVQVPTLPTQPIRSSKATLAIGASIGTVLLLLVFIFARQGLRATVANAEAAGKLARIRRALSLKPQDPTNNK